MIAKIYPEDKPYITKEGEVKPVRYFDIRKLSPVECYRLMGVKENDINTLMTSPLAKSSHYKLAGNSIVEDVLYYIFKQIWAPSERKPEGGIMDMFADEMEASTMPDKVRMVTLCSGYDSQCLAMRRLAEELGIEYELMAWSEFDPESKKDLNDQPAVVAHNALFPQWADRNLGDMTAIDWAAWKKEHDEEVTLLTYSTPCFVAGTMVTTDKGNVPIEKVKVGDMALTSEGYRKVTKFFDNNEHNTYKTTIEYRVDNEVRKVYFEATPNHKIKTARGWVELQDLLHTDKIYVLDEQDKYQCLVGVEAEIVTLLRIGSYSHVYDIEVEEMHEFFAEGVLVHNCQSISQAGKREGIEKGSGTRSAVLWYTEEAIRNLKPKFLLQENVAALLNNNNRRHFNEWCNLVTDLGYENFYTILNSKNFGVPQNRDRVFMLSVRKDVAFNYRFPQGFPLTKTIADVLEEDFDPGLLLKPQNTIRFLRDEETNVDCLYVYTDHKFTDEELAEVRKDPSKYEMPDIEEGEDGESEGD